MSAIAKPGSEMFPQLVQPHPPGLGVRLLYHVTNLNGIGGPRGCHPWLLLRGLNLTGPVEEMGRYISRDS